MACGVFGIAALHLSAEQMHSRGDATRLLEWLVAEKADELDGLAEALRAEQQQTVAAGAMRAAGGGDSRLPHRV